MTFNSGKPTFEMTIKEVKTISDFLWLLHKHFRVEDGNLYRLINDFPWEVTLDRERQLYEGERYNIKIKENE